MPTRGRDGNLRGGPPVAWPFTSGWRDVKRVTKMINGVTYARVHNNVGFNPLPKEEFGHGMDDRCCCQYCSPEAQESRDNPDGVWDTMATDLTTGKTWKVHFPELHGRRPKRRSDG